MIHTLRKGNAWRHLVAVWLQDLGFTIHKRGIGDPGDDITAHLPGMTLSVEAKDHKAITLAAFVDQAEKQAPPDQIPICFIHRPGRAGVDNCYVVLTGRAFRKLIQ
jgi:hypothetical protein